MSFLKNAWYVAAYPHEVTRTLMSCRILNIPIVFFRTEAGKAIALEDRCSHRFVPLSLGRLKNDTIECGYHGMTFDCTGQCVRIFGQTTIPKSSAIKTFPLVEKWRLLWIWMGDPALADETKIPNLWQNDHPEWAVVDGGTPIPLKADYRLVAENLLDPSHVSFVHTTTLGTDAVAEIPIEAERIGDRVRVTRWILDRPAAPLYARLGDFKENVDRWQIITFEAPCFVEVDMGSCIAGTGAPQGNRSRGIELRAFNMVTPVTASSSLYFWTHVRNFKIADDSVSQLVKRNIETAFAEDVAIIEAASAGMADFPDAHMVNIAYDQGPRMAQKRC